MKKMIRYMRLMPLLICVFFSLNLMAEDTELVKPGKKWWYWSFTSCYEGWETVIIGLTLEDADADGWTPCYALDSLGERIMDVPLARLQEKDRIVRIRPNLELYKQNIENPSNELLILSDFLGYWNGNTLKYEEDCIWNPDSVTEFTLYDFNKHKGDLCQWLWSGYDVRQMDDEDSYKELGDLEIIGIDQENVRVAGSEEKRSIKTFNMCYQNYLGTKYENEYGAKIMEGIGMVSGRLHPYLVRIRCCAGFFIAPMSACDPDYSGGFGNRGMPELYSVEEPDGTVLILDEEHYNEVTGAGIENTVVDSKQSNDNIYDLHGRMVANPQPGSLYIRNGKKFVAK